MNMRKGGKVPAWLGPLEGTGLVIPVNLRYLLSFSSLFCLVFFISLYIISEYVVDCPEACIHFKRNYLSQSEGAR
jgi:hypothetical protein